MKKLLVILGAGSSVGLGLPSVDKIDCLMRTWADEWLGQAFDGQNYYAAVEAAIRDFMRSGPVENRYRPVNFEMVLGDMAALVNWVVPAPDGTTFRGLVGTPSGPPLRFPKGAYGASINVNTQLTYLLRRLAEHVRQQSSTIDTLSPSAISYARLISELRRVFDVGIYNLNYDTAALTAWPDAHTGFDADGNFAPKTVHDRQTWGFIYHLHGSVHYSLSYPAGPPIVWRPDLTGLFYDGESYRPTAHLSDGKAMPKTTLVAGGFKLDQLLVEPFHSLAAALVRHAHEADAILIGGYGFGDAHVNHALFNRLEARTGKERSPLMVLDYARPKTKPMQFRDDAWSHNLSRTLAATGNLFFEAGCDYPPTDVYDLGQRSAFEMARPLKTAIWYSGFERAADRVNDIICWLSGDDDHVLNEIR